MAAAYGIGFTAIMLVTSLMAAYLALKKWQWSIWKVGLVFVPFILLDALFFGSSLFKFMDGGWFPLLLTVLLYQIMEVWRKGTLRMHLNTLIPNASLSDYIKSISAAQTMRIPGTAVYLCAQPGVVPSALVLNLQHNKFLHEKIVFLAMLTLRSPSVADHEAIKITHLGDGISQLTVYHGYSGVPNMAEVFARASAQGLAINLEESSFFISEDRLIAAANSKLFGWREKIFIFLYRNVFNTSEHYNIPRNRIIGLGAVYKVRMF